ncbi:hypothetical protein SDC9_141172 [bioreactor metagenome]|uniref:Uncharacterized protein n=1 Tax=bioreactor metagenome TaxID=1076179 RepID=A0A645DWY1_9ZZZZ
MIGICRIGIAWIPAVFVLCVHIRFFVDEFRRGRRRWPVVVGNDDRCADGAVDIDPIRVYAPEADTSAGRGGTQFFIVGNIHLPLSVFRVLALFAADRNRVEQIASGDAAGILRIYVFAFNLPHLLIGVLAHDCEGTPGGHFLAAPRGADHHALLCPFTVLRLIDDYALRADVGDDHPVAVRRRHCVRCVGRNADALIGRQ